MTSFLRVCRHGRADGCACSGMCATRAISSMPQIACISKEEFKIRTFFFFGTYVLGFWDGMGEACRGTCFVRSRMGSARAISLIPQITSS